MSQEQQHPLYIAASRDPIRRIFGRRPAGSRTDRTAKTDRGIRDFLNGKNDGADVLHALYDHVLDEPVPERLKALLRR